MVDLSLTIASDSDQLNADDLVGAPKTIVITNVVGSDDPKQPVLIHYAGEERKTYRPCKNMRRVLVNLWGINGHDYIGRSLTLFRDPDVMFSGKKIGGVRISHASHIDSQKKVPILVMRGKHSFWIVEPIKNSNNISGNKSICFEESRAKQWVTKVCQEITAITVIDDFEKYIQKPAYLNSLTKLIQNSPNLAEEVKKCELAKREELTVQSNASSEPWEL